MMLIGSVTIRPKSVPLFSLSPNGGEGQGEGEVISPEQKGRERIDALLNDDKADFLRR
jgi:hypothetical protein